MSEGLASQLEGYARAYNSLHKDIARDFTLAASIIRSHAEALSQLDAANALLREARESADCILKCTASVGGKRWDAVVFDCGDPYEIAEQLSAKISTYLKDGR